MNEPRSPAVALEAFFPEEISSEKRADLKHALKQLLASEGWKQYIGVITSQQRQRFDQVVLQPLPGADAVYAQEYMKGEIQGLRMAASMPQAIIEAIEWEDHLQKLQETGNENE